MRIDVIKTQLQKYQCKNPAEEDRALREISQEVILMALARADFFKQAEFHGGTALRILHNLQRFSEDLDFALLAPNKQFKLAPYLEKISLELRAFGYTFEIKDRSKAANAVKKAFLKDDSMGKILTLKRSGLPKKITIKLEVDTNPPLGADIETKYLSFPERFGIATKSLPSAFAGKLHALLCRSYLKGRDWYDFLWYIDNKTTVNFALLKNALYQIGPWEKQKITVNKNWLIEQLREKINTIRWENAKKDVMPFAKPFEERSIDLWSTDLFLDALKRLTYYL